MAGTEKYAVLIIGGGQAGIPLARDLAGMGKRVALAERKDLGGSCINFGCTPTKAAIASARLAHLARRGAAFGLKIPTVDVDFLQVLQRARDISIEYRRGLDQRMDGIDNLRLFRGHAASKAGGAMDFACASTQRRSLRTKLSSIQGRAV
jgi:pyruvate/2-oxoglutarate dehydrogenase complex dihydrolipoamide dehydrogenase (E3) component